MQCRDIEALDTQRRRWQRQRTFELQERLIGAVVSVPRSHHVAHEGMARIFGCHIEQTVLFATLRPMEMAGTLTLACKPLPQRLRILKLDGKVDLSWNISRLVVIALKKARLELFLVNSTRRSWHSLPGKSRRHTHPGRARHGSQSRDARFVRKSY